MFVKVAKLGAKVEEVNLATGSTVGDALNVAGVTADNMEMKFNGMAVQKDTQLHADGVLTLVGQIKGGK